MAVPLNGYCREVNQKLSLFLIDQFFNFCPSKEKNEKLIQQCVGHSVLECYSHLDSSFRPG